MKAVNPILNEFSGVLGAFRTHLGTVVRILSSGQLTPIRVARVLGTDNKLGWMIHRIITHEDLFESSQYIPKPEAFDKLMEKCRKRNLDDLLLEKLKTSYGKFLELVEKHAGDRNSFDLLLTSCSYTGSISTYQAQQRAAFNANSHLLGLRASTHFLTWVFIPLTDNTFDILSIRGFIGIVHNRPSIPLILAQPRCFHDDGVKRWQGEIEPLDSFSSSKGKDTPPFYTRFCSKPLPSVSEVYKEHGRTLYEFESPPLGLTGKTDIVFAHLSRNMYGLKRTCENLYREVQMRINIPVETVQLDLISHKSITSGDDPELSLFGDFQGWDWGTNSEGRNCNTMLPLHSSIKKLNLEVDHGHSSRIFFYAEMLQDASRKMNINLADYACFRSSLDYPVIPSTLNIRHSLPSN